MASFTLFGRPQVKRLLRFAYPLLLCLLLLSPFFAACTGPARPTDNTVTTDAASRSDASDAPWTRDVQTDAQSDAPLDLPMDTAVDLSGPPLCIPLDDVPVNANVPTASLLPMSGALLNAMEPIEIRFSEYMHPESLAIGGSLEPGSFRWEPPYEVLLIQPPEGGWTVGGVLVVNAADRACTPIVPLEAAYAGIAEARPLLKVEMRFFLTANDDGQRAAPLTEEVSALWLEETNRIYHAADMQFAMVDDSEAWIMVNDTALNELHALSDPSVHMAAAQLVAPYPDTLNVIFSWGPLAVPAQGGFTSPTMPFISVTSFEDTLLCGDLSRDVLPHEMGHYFGLPHTHQAEFWTIEDAQAAYDGAFLPWDDGFPDTPALPHIAGRLCTPPDSIVLGGIPRTTQPSNVMNYDWTPYGHLTWAQAGVVRQTAAIRFGMNLGDLVSPSADRWFEAEDLAPTNPDAWDIQNNMDWFFGVWSGDTQRIWHPQPGVQSGLRVSVGEAGPYRLFIGFTLGPDFGIHRIGMNGLPGPEINLYSPMVRHSQVLDLGVYPLEVGDNELNVTCLGTEVNSLGTLLGLDYVMVRRE